MNSTFGRQSSFFVFALSWTFVATLLRTLRWPSDWAEAHWLVSYEFGFLKRAFAGTLIKPVLMIDGMEAYAEGIVRIAASTVFFFFSVALLWICTRIVRTSGQTIMAQFACLVFLSSPFVAMSGHLNGYFDSFIILLSIIACWQVLAGRVIMASIVVSLSLLIHEMAFVVGYPAVLFFALLKDVEASRGASALQLLSGLVRRNAILLAAPSAVFLGILIFQVFWLDSAAVQESLDAHLGSFDFIKRRQDSGVSAAISTSFSVYMGEQQRELLQRMSQSIYYAKVLPPVALLIFFGWRCCRGRAHSALVFCAAIAITLAPLSLHAVAWDTWRIWLYPIVVAALVLWGLCEAFPEVDEGNRTSIVYAFLAVCVIEIQIFGMTPLLDPQVERFGAVSRAILYAPTVAFMALAISSFFKGEERSA